MADEDNDAGVGLLAETVSSFLAAGAGATGSAELAVIAATLAPALTRAFTSIANRVSTRRRQRCGEVYLTAANLADLSLEDLTEQVLADENLLDVFSRVLLHVQDMTGIKHRRGLARALAAGVLDPAPARLDIARLLDRAISNLDEGHLRVMTVLWPVPRRPIDAPPGTYGLLPREIVERDPGLDGSVLPLLLELVSSGLAEESTGGFSRFTEGTTHTLSAFGQRVYRQLGDEGFERLADCLLPIGT
jgi:hypothetical protein